MSNRVRKFLGNLGMLLCVSVPVHAAGTLYAFSTEQDVQLRWNAPFDQIYQGFHVERKEKGGDWIRLTTSPVKRITSVNDIRLLMGPDAESFLTFFDAGLTNISDADLNKVMNNDFARSMIQLFSVKFPIMGIVLAERYIDDQIETGKSFDYRIVILDDAGAEQSWAQTSDPVDHGKLDVLPVPDKFAGIGAENSAFLNWRHDSAQSRAGRQVGYRVYRSEDPLEPFQLVTVDTLIPASVDGKLPDSLFVDQYLTNGQRYWYYVTSVDVIGFESNPSELIEVTPGDMTPPPPPENFQGRIMHGDGQLQWDPVEAADLAGYRILRSSLLEGPYEIYSPVEDEPPLFSTIFNDTSVAESALLYYIVVSEDESGNRSIASETVQLFREDKTPPATPTKLLATSDDEGIHITWSTNTEADLAGYILQRTLTISGNADDAQADDDEFYVLNSAPLTTTEFIDPISKFSQARYAYRLIAVDFAFNESEPTETIIVRMPDIVPPGPPALYRAVRDQDTITLLWQKKILDDLAGFRVFRTTEDDRDNYELISGKDLIAFDATSYLDHPAKTDVMYHYTMTALDETGNESERPSPVKIWFFDKKPPELPQNVQIISEETGLKISWDPIPDDDLWMVSIFRYEDNADEYIIVARLEDKQTDFLDRNVEEDNEYSYFFETMDDSNNRSDKSSSITTTYKKPESEEK